MTENIQDIYPLSPMQQGMLFHSLYEPESGVYVEQFSCRLRGDFDLRAFEKAWKKVMERHPILRTSFVWEDLDEPLQVVHKSVDLPLEYLDWSAAPADSVRPDLDELLKRERAAGIDLGKAPLFRLAVVRLGDGSHYFVWTHHHILVDGWSLPILLGELFKLYEGFAKGQDVQLPPVRPYRDYIAWLKSKDPAEAEQYWRAALSGFHAPTPLLNSEPDPDRIAYGEERYFLSEELSTRLEELARTSQVTIGSLVNGIWALQLSRYSGEKDVVFGTTVSGRPAELPGVENMVGLFINTLPVRVQIDDDAPAVEFLQKLHRQLAEIRQYEYTPLVQIQGWSDVPRDTALFESITVFENYPVETTLAQQRSSLQIEEVSTYGQTNYPLTIVSGPGKRLGFTVAFEGTRFSRRAVREILSHTEQLLASLAENPGARLGDLDLLTENERRQIVVDWNRDQDPVRAPAPTVVAWFEDVAANNSDKIGLVAPDASWTFAELNSRANQIARRLRDLGVGPEDLVGISLDRSADFVASILGVLKAGAAYVPLDPSYPKDRLRYMVTDSGAKTIVTRDALAGLFEDLEVDLLRLDSDAQEIEKQSSENLGIEIDPLSLAYVIYTSGSTGRPKGVLVQHAGLANLMATILRDFEVGPESRVLEFASFSFDASVAELFEGLLSGGTTFVVDRDTAMSAEALGAYIRENKLTVVTLPPTMLRVLSPDGLDSVRTVISAGESCSWDVVERWANGRRFLNGYGPTEGTVGCAWQVVAERVPGSATAPVGRSINGVQVYLLDPAFRPVPVGAPGEVYIGGAGVARGYLGRPDITAEKFLPDPFSGEAGARLYRTGDLGRYHPDGSIEILGRVDFQVKIRGYRIEIGEIESVLTGHPQVQEAAVKAWASENGEKQLVAYVVTKEGQELDVEALRDYLKAELPDYMVPVAFVHLDAMPLTPNRKIDRRALPKPEEVGVTLGEPYEEPRTPTEELLAELMASVLNVERVGARDDFFARGGHSLLATQLVSRIRDVFDVELPLRDLFANSTVRELAALIDARKAEQVKLPKPPLEPVPRDGELPLSFAQQRLWFLDQLEPGNPFYNIPTSSPRPARRGRLAREHSRPGPAARSVAHTLPG
ncbi:MAG: amino acid adenylation domain-containing protein [Calditrichaeota bacterium]|nr:amino acid adenylation domain-containing protein [Calditrichota bacterium]